MATERESRRVPPSPAGFGTRDRGVPRPPAPKGRDWDSICPIALRREAAAEALGVSVESFDRYIRPTLPVVRLGTVRVYPVAALEDWLRARAETPADELEARR